MEANASSNSGTLTTNGWYSAPNTRGTFDILWTCAQTAALCAWTSTCVNLPSSKDGSLAMLRDKFHFVLLTLLGPDLVFLLAYTQLQSARASVKQFKASGYSDWTLVHAFYADMGGFTVQPLSWKRFPVNAKQLHYLVTNDYMQYPLISSNDIKARGKADGLGRLVTIAQTLYFTVTTLGRIVQGLAITTLELTVLGFVFCTLATSVCWWHKPNDVEAGHTFELGATVEEILQKAGDGANGTYRDTPLDFVCDERWAGTVLWAYYVKILRQTGLFPATHLERPIQRLSSFNFPKPSSQRSELLVLWIGLAYVATFFGAWNFYFPTSTERLLWRVVSTVQCALSVFVGVFEISNYNWPSTSAVLTRSRVNPEVERSRGENKENRGHLINLIWKKSYNNSVSQNPFYDVPIRSLIVTTPLCAAYCICRWYLLLEDLIGLRSVPSSVYKTVEWAQYWPSF